MKNIYIIGSFLLCLCSAFIDAQAQKAYNVVPRVEGSSIVIKYDLAERAKVSLQAGYVGRNFYTMTKVSGDVNKVVRAGKGKEIRWRPLDEYFTDLYKADDVVFKVVTKPTAKFFVLGEFAFSPAPQYSGGIMFGMVWNWGWYAKFRSSFNFRTSTDGLICNADGSIDGYVPFYSGNTAKPELIIDAGVVCRMGIPLYLCVGLGYGHRNVLWETIGGSWVKNKAYSYGGFSGDICLMGCIKGFTIMVGVNNINFQYVEFECGAGWMF